MQLATPGYSDNKICRDFQGVVFLNLSGINTVYLLGFSVVFIFLSLSLCNNTLLIKIQV